MEEMREQEGWERVVEVGVGLVGEAEWAVSQHVWAVGKVEAAGVEGGEAWAEQAIRVGEGEIRTE